MKEISIIGSCCTRDLFEFDVLKSEFAVKDYIFQIASYDMFTAPINVPVNKVNTLPIANFIRRCCGYDLNKTAIDVLNEHKTEYIAVDLYTIGNTALRLTEKKSGKVVYVGGHYVRDIYPAIQKWKGVKAELIPSMQLDSALLKNGITRLAEWLKQNYDPDKIIINYPIYCKKYIDRNGNVVKYDDGMLKTIKNREKRVYECTDLLCSLIPGAVVIKSAFEEAVAVYRLTDGISVKVPSPVHLRMDLVLQMANYFYSQVMGKSSKSTITKQLSDYCSQIYAMLVGKNLLTYKMASGVYTNLNYYVENKINLDRHIVCIAVKNQASEKIHKFFNKSILGIKMPLERCISYVALIDKPNNMWFESCNKNGIASCNYKGEAFCVEINSNYQENYSSIKVNNYEYCTNRRGLNFVIIDRFSGEVLDSFYCDTYQDENLLITPWCKIDF